MVRNLGISFYFGIKKRVLDVLLILTWFQDFTDIVKPIIDY